MRPLTDATPKPLLKAGNYRLIEYHLFALHQAGFTEVIINTAYLGEQIEAYLQDGSRYGVTITYSHEGEPLETAGAIIHALPLIGNDPFVLVNGDIYTDFPFAQLKHQRPAKAHVILVPNPDFKPQGDFGIDNNKLTNVDDAKFTYAGIGVYSPQWFQEYTAGDVLALGPLLREAAQSQHISAEIFDGQWMDIGTPDRLQQLDQSLRKANDSKQG